MPNLTRYFQVSTVAASMYTGSEVYKRQRI